MSLYSNYKENTGLFSENKKQEEEKSKNILQKIGEIFNPPEEKVITEKPKKSLYQQYQDEINPPKQSTFSDTMAELGLRQSGWQNIEKKGEMTPTLSAMEKAGFSAHVNSLPVVEAGMPRIDPTLKISQGNFDTKQENIADEIRRKGEEANKYLIEQGKLKNITTNRYVKDFVIGAGGTVEGMVGAAEWLSPEVLKPFFKEKGDQLELWQKRMSPDEQNFVDALVQGAGSASTFFIPGIGIAKGASVLARLSPKIALLFGNSVATALEAMTEAGSVYREKEKMGFDNSLSSKSATKTFIANAVLIGLTNKFGAFSDKISGRIKRAIASAPMEGLQEFFQQIIQNSNTNKKDIYEGALESGVIGTILGVPMGAIGGGVSPEVMKNRIEEKFSQDSYITTQAEAIEESDIIEKPQETTQEVAKTTQNTVEAPKTEQPKAKFVYSEAEPQTLEASLAEEQATKVEFDKTMNAETGKPVELTGWNTGVGERDSGWRSPDRYESQSYYSHKFNFANEGIVNVNKHTEKLENPYVADNAMEVLKFLGRNDRLELAKQETARVGGLRPDNKITIEDDNIIRAELMKQGYDGVIYKNGGRRAEWQIFNVKRTLPQQKQAMKELKTVEDYDAEIERQIDNYRQEADLMASNEGAGIRYYMSDQVGGENRLYSYFKEDKAKSDMYERAKDLKNYAKELLYENSAEFRKLVDDREKILEERLKDENYVDPNEIDVKAMFDKFSEDEQKINEFKNKVEELIEAQPNEVAKNKEAEKTPARESQKEQKEVKPQEPEQKKAEPAVAEQAIAEPKKSEAKSEAEVLKNIKAMIPSVDKAMSGSVQEFNAVFDDIYSEFDNYFQSPTNKKIEELKSNLEALKTDKTKEAKNKKKTIKDEIDNLQNKIEKLDNDYQGAWLDFSFSLGERAIKQAEKSGIEFVNEEEKQDFKDNFLMSLTERPYIESNWEMPVKDVLADIIEEYKPQNENKPETTQTKKQEEKPTDVFKNISVEKGALEGIPVYDKEGNFLRNVGEEVRPAGLTEADNQVLDMFAELRNKWETSIDTVGTDQEEIASQEFDKAQRRITIAVEEILLNEYEKKYNDIPNAFFDVSQYPETNKIEVGFYSKETDVPESRIFGNVNSVLEAMKEYQDENGNKYAKEINAGIMGKSKKEINAIYEDINKNIKTNIKAGTGITIPSGTELYHGTSKDNADSIRTNGIYTTNDETATYGQGVYLTTDEKAAEDYSKEFEDGGKVLSFTTKKDLKLYTPTKQERENLVDLIGTSQQELIDAMLGDKYDGFNLPDIGIRDGSPQIVLYEKGSEITKDFVQPLDFVDLTENIIKGKIKSYDKQKQQFNRDIRGGNIPSGISEAIRVGEEQPSDTQRPVAEFGGQGLRREGGNGDRMLRERLEISKADQVAINSQIEKLVAQKGDDTSSYTEDEKNLLSQYSGYGGLEQGGADNRGLLDEYFTPQKVVSFIWNKVNNYLPKSGEITILEPSVGTGNFISEAPSNASIEAFEINETSAKIAKILYPDAKVKNTPFESLFIDNRGNKSRWIDEYKKKGLYNLIIGNPPYGEHRGTYKGLGEEPKISKYEEYFLKRSLDIAKDNGIVAFVVPSGFLKSSAGYSKVEISKLGKLVEAYRLPENVFDNTSIGTDIVIFKKSPLEQEYRQRYETISNDKYFEKNPDKILGIIKERKNRFGAMETYVEGSLDILPEQEKEIKKVVEVNDPTETITEKQDIVNAIENDINKGAIIKEKEFVKNWGKEDVNQPSLFTPREKTVGGLEPTKFTETDKSVIETPKKTSGVVDLSTFYQDKSDKEIETYIEIEATGELKEEYVKRASKDEAIKISYMNYMNGKWYNNFNYFSGDIYDKLDNLEADKLRGKVSEAQYKKQKEGLLKVLPEIHTIDRINISPNTPFAETNINYNGKNLSLKRAFIEFLDTLPRDTFSDISKWEIKEYVLEQSVRGGDKVRNQVVRVKRREAGNRLFKMFLTEGLELEQRKFVEDKYNRQYNSYAKTDYRDVPLFSKLHKNFYSKELEIKPHQLQGIGFLINKGVGLIAHDVGLGKTMQTIISINETMKRGWAKRPLIVVPTGNAYGQWIREMQEILPGVKITSLANLGKDFKGNIASLEIEDGTISIITYEGFKKLGFKDQTYFDLTKDLQDTIGEIGGMTKRAREKEKAKIQETIGKGMKGTILEKTFEDFGFDLVAMDEVQNANHIVKGAKMQENGKASEFRGLTVKPSELGVKAWLATQYVLKNNNGRNVYLASATPFTNNPMEYYSVLSLMARERLMKMGIRNVNEFMNTFMDISFDFEITADGNYKERNNIKGFKNYQQFQKLLTEFIDFKDGDEVGIKRPERVSVETTLKPTQKQLDLMAQAQTLFTDKELKGGILKGVGEMRSIAFSPYASSYNNESPKYKEFVENSPKVKAMMEMIRQNRKDNKGANQVIYSPIGVEYFPLMKDYLVKEVGFRPDEVGIITGSVKSSQRVEIQENFNAGKIKIIIGSDAIQEGLNLQKKSTDLYILSLPWNFTELKQVSGRIWRQGNEWQKVRIHNLFIENSVDVFQAQKLDTKQQRYENSLKYKGDYLDVGDIDFDELKLDLIKSPVRRVAIEKSQERKIRERALNEAKSDLGFYSRKAQKLNDVLSKLTSEEESLEGYKRWAKDSKDDVYWKERLVEQQARVDKMKTEYEVAKKQAEEKGLIDNNQISTLTKIMEDAQKKLDNLDKEFQDREARAKKDEEAMVAETISEGNNYTKIASDLATQNKTFFVKNELTEQDKKPAKRSPSGLASAGGGKIGEFENIKDQTDTDKIKLFEEVKGLIRKYAQRVGEGYLPSNAVGVLYPSDTIRIKGMNALSIATHEISHYLDRVFKVSDQLMGISGYTKNGYPIYDKETKLFRKEMTNLYEKYYPTGKKSHRLKKRMVEGFATLLEKYIEQPTLISKEYPNLVNEFLMPGGTFYEPSVGELITDTREIVSRYQNLPPLEKIGARVIYDNVNVDKNSFLNFKDKVKTFIADNMYPIEKLAKMSGVHFTKLDPSLWLRQYNNSNALIVNNIKKNDGYWGWRDGNIKKIYDYNWYSIVRDLEQNGITMEFGNYLVARNEYFLFQELKTTNDKIQEYNKKILGGTELSETEQADFQELKDKSENIASILENDGFTEQEVKEAYEAGQEKFAGIEDMYDNLVREDLNFLHDKEVQLVDDDQYKKLTERRGYASMKRVFYDEIVGEEQNLPGTRKVGGVRASSLIGRKGSERPILHPVNSALLNHAEMTRKGLKQIVYNRMGDLAPKFPTLFQELQLKVLPDKNGVLRFPQEKDPNIIMARKNYKRNPVLVDGVIKNAIDDVLIYQNINVFEKIVYGFSRFFTKGTTGLFPGFALTNYTIDQITATAQTRNKYIPIYTPLKELMTILDVRRPDHSLLLEYLIAGGERQTFVGWQDLAPKELFDKITKEREGIMKFIDKMNEGADILAIPSKYSEVLTRATEYMRARRMGKPSVVALEEAGRVTAPFHHIGSWGGGRFWKGWIKSIPFFNPSIQVLAQSAETLNNPNLKQRYLFVMLSVIASSIASVIATLMVGSDEQKELLADLSPQDLSNYIYLPYWDGKSLSRIRVSQEMSFVATIINMAIMDRAMKAQYTGKEYIEAATAWLPQQLNPTDPVKMFLALIPQMIKPGFLTIAGVTDYPEIRPLESQSLQNRLPENRYNQGTSIVAKWLGKTFGMSPIKIDYLATGYLGRSIGFVMGKPGIYDPFKGLKRDYYFESGRTLQKYYDLKNSNDKLYNDYKDKRIKLSSKEMTNMLKERSKLKQISDLLKTYNKLDPDKQPKTLQIYRNKILNQIKGL